MFKIIFFFGKFLFIPNFIPLTYCDVTVSRQQMLAFELSPVSNRDGLFPLQYGGHNIHDFQKHFEMQTRSTSHHLR